MVLRVYSPAIARPILLFSSKRFKIEQNTNRQNFFSSLNLKAVKPSVSRISYKLSQFAPQNTTYVQFYNCEVQTRI